MKTITITILTIILTASLCWGHRGPGHKGKVEIKKHCHLVPTIVLLLGEEK